MPEPIHLTWDAPTTAAEVEEWLTDGFYREFIRWSLVSIDDQVSVAISMRDRDERIVYTLIPPDTFRALARRILPQLDALA
jgi:hypothetical protein